MSHRFKTALRLSGTHSRLSSLLDFPSALAVEYAQAWAIRQGGLKVPSSAIVRRALLVYVRHLEAQHEPPAALVEWRAIKQACDGGRASSPTVSSCSEADAQEAALGRVGALSDLPAGQPLPPFSEALYGPEEVAAVAAMVQGFTSSASAILCSVSKTKAGRFLPGVGEPI